MKIIVLAGGFDQIALIERLHKKGHYVVLVDYYDDPPAKAYADKHYQISTLHMDAVLKIAIEEKIDLITTACTDQALVTVAYVSEKMGLPTYISYDTAKKVTNKEYMKKRFAEFHIPTASSFVVKTLEDIDKYKYSFPMIVKPTDCNSSKGVQKVNDQKELVHALENALRFSRSHTAIIEPFVNGMEISIDIWIDKEGVKILSISETVKMDSRDRFTIYQSKYPAGLSVDIESKITTIATDICHAFQLKDCPVLIQAIIHDHNVIVVEFSARMGGGSKYKLIEYMSGVPIMDIYVDRILGDMDQIIVPKRSKKKIELNYVYGYEGTYDTLVNFEELYDKKSIKELFIYKTKGSIICDHTTSGDRILGFLIVEDEDERLDEQRQKIIQMVDILDTNGRSMMIKECFK